MYSFLKALALPPGSVIALLIAGLIATAFGRRRSGLTLIVLASILLYLSSTPFFSSHIARLVQQDPALPTAVVKTSDAQAIVVLSAGYAHSGREYGGQTIDGVTLQRLRYAAHLSRLNHLPILVSGGRTETGHAALADLMSVAMEQDFSLPVKWVERQSTNTIENAAFSSKMLRADDVTKILLVTHASHMPRARGVFESQGMVVIPAPTEFAFPGYILPDDLLPRLSALEESYYTLYEILGQAWYAMRSVDGK